MLDRNFLLHNLRVTDCAQVFIDGVHLSKDCVKDVAFPLHLPEQKHGGPDRGELVQE